jgi:hypothetical protein
MIVVETIVPLGLSTGTQLLNNCNCVFSFARDYTLVGASDLYQFVIQAKNKEGRRPLTHK